jgi:hypothetical protein
VTSISERCSANARSTAEFPATVAPQLAAMTAEKMSVRNATSAGRARSAFEVVEDEAGHNKQYKRDHDDDRHSTEVLRHVPAFPRGRSLEAR